ncbi:MAG: carboxy-S-adenosyl-L-methionine synthase CmoA, partial [Pseudomonadota bacterium]
MSHDDLFHHNTQRGSDFAFDEKVARVFDDMLARSIPLYAEQQKMIGDMAARFWVNDTRVVDLGCSLGTTLISIASLLPGSAQMSGYDNARAMLERATANVDSASLGNHITLHHADLNGDLDNLDLSNTSVVTLCWTLQFVRPLRRDRLINKIYESLVDGGILIITDKVLTNDSNMNRFFIDFYYDYKRRNGYSDEEIMRKREALENVLVPLT